MLFHFRLGPIYVLRAVGNGMIIFMAPYNVTGYHFYRSETIGENVVKACGLLLDVANHPELTDARIAGWVESVKAAG